MFRNKPYCRGNHQEQHNKSHLVWITLGMAPKP